jgi:hypothetical protein
MQFATGQRAAAMNAGIAETLGYAVVTAEHDEVLIETPNLDRLLTDFLGRRHRVPEIDIHCRASVLSGRPNGGLEPVSDYSGHSKPNAPGGQYCQSDISRPTSDPGAL